MGEHALATLVSLLLLCMLTLSCFGWGRSLAEKWRLDTERAGLTVYVWVGWATLLLVFQTVHLLFPLNVLTVSPPVLIGLLLLVRNGVGWARIDHRELGFRWNVLWSLKLLLVFAGVYWLLARTMLPADQADSGLYYLSSIRWLNEYPVVPGLGNLHGRLAFNQSYLSFAAALNFYPVYGHGKNSING
jgi:hypothetical protein